MRCRPFSGHFLYCLIIGQPEWIWNLARTLHLSPGCVAAFCAMLGNQTESESHLQYWGHKQDKSKTNRANSITPRNLQVAIPGTYTKHGPGSMDHPMDPVHGPPWTWTMDRIHGPGPWTTPNFQKEIAPVKMKIYWRSGYEKHRPIFFHQYTLITNLFS